MLGSFDLGRLFGIRIRCSWTFLLLVPLFITAPRGMSLLQSSLVFVALFASVLLHELGHALVARRLGIHVVDITFWPLGGMARMSEIPESPRVEGAIALAGPAVNGALALLGGALVLVGLALDSPVGPYLAMGGTGIALINLVLGIFNLLPAFPMDGGRVLRAWFGRKQDWVQATDSAVGVGRWVALLMVIASFFVPGANVFVTGLIALFVWLMGGRERMAVRMRHGLNPFGGDRPMPFGPMRPTDGPRAAEWQGTRPAPASEPVDAEANGEARRPTDWDGSLSGGGFSDEDVEALERFRGRLPRS